MYLPRPARRRHRSAELSRLAALFKALSDPTRLRMLALLGAGELCVCHIYESLGIPQSKASRHLAYLRRAGLVTARKIGLWVYYRQVEVTDAPTRAMIAALTGALAGSDVIKTDCCRLAESLEQVRPRREPEVAGSQGETRGS